MFYRVPMDVIHMLLEIIIVLDDMIPEARLPELYRVINMVYFLDSAQNFVLYYELPVSNMVCHRASG
jgi:hypothetical protein